MRHSMTDGRVLPLLLAAALLSAWPHGTCAAFTCASAPTNLADSCAALGDLYAATRGASWTNKAAWASAARGTPTDYCTYAGVSCSGADVISLYLPSNNLQGTLPASLGALTSLTSLDLHGNLLTGTVPPQVAALYLPCDGLNIVSGANSNVTGCFNVVTGDNDVVNGRGNVVTGNNDLVNGTNDRVHGNYDRIFNLASSDTIVGNSDTMESDSFGNEIRGSNDVISYHADYNSVAGGHTIIQRNANGNTVVGDYDSLQDNAQNNYVQGKLDYLRNGAVRSTVIGDNDVLMNGATDDTVDGSYNRVQYGAVLNAVTGLRNIVQNGASGNIVDGVANVLRNGARNNHVTGAYNDFTTGATSDDVSGTYNVLERNSVNNSVVGDSNVLQDNSASNAIDGWNNVVSQGAQRNQVVGSFNRLQNGVADNEVRGRYDTVQNGAAHDVVDGDYNVVNQGASSDTVHGHRNVIQAASHDFVDGNRDVLQNDADSDTVVGDRNYLQYQVGNVSVSGNRNIIQRNSYSDTIVGDSNKLLQNASDNEVLGDSNLLQLGAVGNVVVGANNALQQDAAFDMVSGDGNSLSYQAYSDSVDGSFNIVQQQANGNSITGSFDTLEEAANRNQVVGDENYLGHSASDNMVAGDDNALHAGSRYNRIYGFNNSAESGAFNDTIRGSQDFVVAANMTSVRGDSDLVRNVSAPVTSVRGDSISVTDAVASTYISVDADFVNIQRVTASGYISAIVDGGTQVDASGANVVVYPSPPVGPGRRLQQLARQEVYSSTALTSVDLSGNQLTWTCDPSGEEGPENDAATCAAMQALYRTNGWTALAVMDRWPTRNYCTSLVAGLGCNGDGDISSLLLNSSNLVGTLPAQLSRLTALTALRLDSNSLSGGIPAVANMPALVTLRLSNSGLCGTVPPPLQQDDTPSIVACPRSPPPPPSPPSPPLPPPPPSPNPVYGPLSGFPGAISCPGVEHQFESALPDTLQGSTPVYRDMVFGSSWNLTAAAATAGAPPAAYTGLPLIGPLTHAASSADLFSVPQQAWLFRGSNGALLQPSSAALGSALGFSIALWFRVDAAGMVNPAGNVLAQLSVAAGPGYSVVLSLLASFNTSGVLAAVAQFSGNGASTTEADYAVSSSSDEFGQPSQQPNGGNVFTAIGDWQHAVVTFNGAGLQTGLFWNGREQDDSPYWEPLDLGLFFGTAAPYGPVLGGSLGFDASSAGPTVFSPLIGAVGSLQIYGYELDSASVLALFTSLTSLCSPLPAALSPPPMPPAPPGGFSPPPPLPPPRAPRPPVERLLSGTITMCLTGASSQELDAALLETGLQSYLGIFIYQILFYNSTDGCDLSLISSRRLLQARATVSFIVQDVTAGQVATKISPLYGAGSASARAELLREFVAAGVSVVAVAPLGLSFVPAAEPPPVFRPPLPPGLTPAAVLAASNQGKHTNNGVLERLRRPEAIVGYTIAAVAVLFVPVYLLLQCAQAGHERRTCVSAALVLHVEEDAPARTRALAAAIAADGGAHPAGGEGAADEAARFKAPHLAAALTAALGKAVEAGGYSAKRTLLRPLLRAPLLAALGAAAKPQAAYPGDDPATLALRHKPGSMRLRLKRSLRTELHWQGRELRQLWRRLRRAFSRSRDEGKVFRHAPAGATCPEGTTAVLVEVTWKFSSRDGASAWRHRLRDEAHLAAMERELAAALAAAHDPALPPLELAPVPGAGCTVALLDDEPHARLDKKRGSGEKERKESEASPPAGEARTHGLSPAVAARLQEVLRLSLRSLTSSRASLAARRASGGLFASPRASTAAEDHATSTHQGHAIEEHEEHEEEEEEEEEQQQGATRVELLAAVSTEVHQPAAAPASETAQQPEESDDAEHAV